MEHEITLTVFVWATRYIPLELFLDFVSGLVSFLPFAALLLTPLKMAAVGLKNSLPGVAHTLHSVLVQWTLLSVRPRWRRTVRALGRTVSNVRNLLETMVHAASLIRCVGFFFWETVSGLIFRQRSTRRWRSLWDTV